MRARQPDREGYAERDGVRLWYEVHGSGATTVLLIPGWALPARAWKAQIPYLARHYRVIAYDPRGTGRSDRPLGPTAYSLDEHTADARAVLDAAGVESAVVISKSRGSQTALRLAVDHAETVIAMVAAAPMIPLSPWPPLDSIWDVFEEKSARRRRMGAARTSLKSAGLFLRSADLRRFSTRVKPLEAADRFSRQGILDDFVGFTRWFQTQVVATDPHSTKQTDDLIAWMDSTGARSVADSFIADCVRDPAVARALCERISCPVLVIHGTSDLAVPFEWGRRFAGLTGNKLFAVPGAGHLPGSRYPVVVNLAIREFIESLYGRGHQQPSDERAVRP